MKQGAAYFGPWLQANPDCRAVSSHWVTPPLPHLPRTHLHLCLLLRDPIERMQSVYQFERAQQGVDTPGSIKAKQLDFAGYMRWQLQPMPGPVVKNYQTRYCSGDYLGFDLEAMYERACTLLSTTGALGLVHRYDESMVLFESVLRPHFPELDLSYIRQNVISSRDTSTAERREQVLWELGDLAEPVIEANRYDLRLFDLAERRFDELLAAVPDFDRHLDDLRRRNRALVAGGGA